MSTDVVNLQAQVESVLGALVRAATVELTKLFESSYRAAAVEAGRAVGNRESEIPVTLDGLLTANTKRSIGVQVDEGIHPPLERPGPPPLPYGDCKEEEEAVEMVMEGCLIPSAMLLAEGDGHVDPEWSPLKEEVLAEMVDIGVLEEESPADSGAQTEVVLQVCAVTSMRSSPDRQIPLVVLPDTSDVTSEEKVKFVCPLILIESPPPGPDSLEEPVRAEPQQACVSTARGTAYSPSPSDGAMTPAQVGVWERIPVPKETQDNLHMKLKLTSPDQKLMRRCAVQLVNVLTVPDSAAKRQDDVIANHRTGWRLPKDLRRHQGLHTGHRLCCFTPCDSGVWRLQSVVGRSRDGYACSNCGKTFKHRKILRRHERFHSGEKPYPCSLCSKTFALRKSLRRHLRFHTGERPHTCTHCSKSFRLRENLKSHLRSHSGEKPFDCAKCGKTFRIQKNLEKHNMSQCGYFVPSFRMIAGL